MSLKLPDITLFEDDNLLFINKPSGIVVNRSHTTKVDTLQDYLDERLDYSNISNEEYIGRSGIVHRLDKDTSGVLVVAKNPTSFYFLQKQFKKRLVKKLYYAVVFGKLEDKAIEIDAPIGRDPKTRNRMCILQSGRQAKSTLYLKKELNFDDANYSLITVAPETGRTHQIRVHCLAINHPVVCDRMYMTRFQLNLSQKHFNRLMLHAFSLEISHPISKEKINIEAELPIEFVQILEKS